MTALRFKHLGVAVADIGTALPVYEALFGYRLLNGPFADPIQEVTVCFVGSGDPGDMVLELVAPLGEDSPIRQILAKGVSAYHACYEVCDIEQSVADVRVKGCVVVGKPVPAVAFQGRRIAWIYTPTRQLIELVES